jgi:hypothetical protein
MRKGGRGPRDVLVRKYPRWRDGKRQTVKKALRGKDHALSVRASRLQLKLDLKDPPARLGDHAGDGRGAGAPLPPRRARSSRRGL